MYEKNIHHFVCHWTQTTRANRINTSQRWQHLEVNQKSYLYNLWPYSKMIQYINCATHAPNKRYKNLVFQFIHMTLFENWKFVRHVTSGPDHWQLTLFETVSYANTCSIEILTWLRCHKHDPIRKFLSWEVANFYTGCACPDSNI